MKPAQASLLVSRAANPRPAYVRGGYVFAKTALTQEHGNPAQVPALHARDFTTAGLKAHISADNLRDETNERTDNHTAYCLQAKFKVSWRLATYRLLRTQVTIAPAAAACLSLTRAR